MRQILTKLTLVLSVILLTEQALGQCSPDIQPPTITTCPPSTTFFVDAAPAGSCVHTITNTEQSSMYPVASDNCTPPPSLTYQLTYFPNGQPSVGPTLNPTLTGIQLPSGPNIFVWRVIDAAGNISTSCTYIITVVDNTPPSITCGVTEPQNVTADATCNYVAPSAWNATATDNCLVNSLTYALTGVTTGTGTDITGVQFNLGTTTVTWTATDNATPANTSTCSFTVVVTDVTPPVLTCNNTTNQNLNTDAGECNYTQTTSGWNASATDNCTVASVLANLTGATIASNLTSLTGQDFALGTTTVTWTATDGSGNTTTCSFTVTVSDIVPPVVTTCPANQTVSMNPNACTYTHTGTTWNPLATDNCTFTMAYALTGATILPSGGSTLNGQVFNPGVTTVTWTITDNSGNTASCVYTVTVNDTQNPTITCGVTTTQNITLGAGLCTYTHAGTAWDATASDNCTLTSLQYTLTGVSTGSGTSLAGQVFNLGTTTVTWTATDNTGNTSTCSFDVVVTDDELPVITCTSNQSVNMDPGQCTFTQPDNAWNASATDNCTINSITYELTGATTGTGTTLNGIAFNFGETTVTWTATDNSANSATCSYTVTVADNQIPVITCVTDQPFNTDAGFCTYTQADASLDPVTSDNCPTILTYDLTGATTGSGSNTLAGVEFNTGVTTITWTLDDSHGNTVTCSHQITVTDVELPVITQCGPGVNTTVSADPGVCNYTNIGNAWDATASDNCAIATIEYDLSGVTTLSGSTTLDGVVFNLGTTTVLWTVTDVNGNIATCTYDIVVDDTELPVITCNQTTNLTLPADAGGCTYLNNGPGWDATATDNCGIATVIYTLTGATIGSGTSLDGVVFTGLTTVTWTATDVNGNTSTCSFDVLIEDTQVPTISCTSNQTVVADAGVCTYTNSGTTWDATGTDNCTISFAYSLSGVTSGSGVSLDGISFNLGLTTVSWTVTDGAGNSATCSFTVTVNDTENPVITCAADQVVNSDAGVCTYAHSGTSWDPIASDNCSQTVTYELSGATTGNGGASIDGVVFNGGITTITWTTTDGAGNTASCVQIVEVDDTENPVITNCGLDANQTVIADAGVCTYTHSGNTWDAQATDNCNVSSITYSLTGATSGSGATLDGQVFNLGITTVTWTVLDDSLNSVTCTYDVTVNDTELPVITTCGPGSNQTVSADNGVCSYTHLGSAWDALASDNCSVASIAYTITGATNDSGTSLDGVTFNSGLSTVVWTVTDGSGNISTCTFDVTVEDNENPVVTSCGGNTIENVISDAGVCTYTHSGTTWDATGTDNCAVATILADLSGATAGIALTTLDAVVFNLGNTIVTWTITDLAGNSTTCTFTVTVEDTENPVITCVPDPSVNTDAGVCTYTVVGTTWDATSADNCSSTVSYIISGVTSGNGTSLDGVVFNLGVSTVTWTATDGAGNTDVCTQTITVTDAELPVVNCQTTQTVSTDPNVCTYTHTGTAWDATGSDNCSVSYAYDLTGVTTGTGTSLAGVTFNLGTTTVTWTATDGSGNTTTCSFDVTVNDTQSPAFTNCGNGTNPTVLANAGVCTFTYTATGWNSAATDNCTLASVVYDLSGVTTGTVTSLTGVVFNLGETTVTWTATDVAGNTSTCSYTVTVNELEAPVITTCGVTTSVDVVADPGVCTYTNVGSTWDALATDNCIISSIAYTLTGSTTGTGLTTLDGVAFSTGTTNVLWTVTDGSGNTATCQYTVNVTDDQAPVIAAVLPDLTVECSPTAPEAVDNCGPVAGVSDFTTYTGDTVVVVTWTFTDGSGNTATALQTITYDDVTAPVVPAIPDAIAQCDTTISAITTTDVCMGTIVGTTTDPLTYTSQGNFTVTWTFNDGNGNTSTATQNVIILDVTDPSISAPPTVNVYPNNAGCTAIIPDLGTPVTTDNCQVVSVTNDGPATYPLGATTVTWTVTDIGGNTTTATQTVNVLPLTSTLDTVACDVYISPDGIDLTPFGSGTYTAVIPGSFGCDSTITINLTLNQSSSSTITLAACDLYNAPDGAIYNNSGVYTAIIPNAAGCDSTITINLTIDSIETADVVMNDMVLTALQATDVTYQWVSCDNGYSPISGANQQSFDVLQYPLPSGDYAVILTNNTCVDTSECVNISIETIIPQLVTPNGDGSNDVFEIQGVYDYPNNILEIYNRWGNLVYRQESYQNNWGGECTEGLTLGGDILPTGTYFFIFDKGLNDGNKPVKGYIFLTK